MTQPSHADRLELAASLRNGPLTGLDAANAEEFDTALLSYLRERTAPRFFFDHKAAADVGAEIARQHPAEADWVIDRAKHVLDHRFPASDGDYLPYDVQLPEVIDWQDNPTVEPSFVFTLNRHRPWPELAMAYRFTGDARYVAELQRQVVSWCEQSPRLDNPDDWKSRPHYTNLLDAAIRADTWTWALFLVLDSPAWQPAVNTFLVHRLLVNARFLKHLTPRVGMYTDWASNWLIMQAQGLMNIALMFPEFLEAADWREHASEVLRLCAESQFFSDGGHCEQSPSYHEGCLRWLTEPLYLARLNGFGGLEDSWTAIGKACEFHYQLTMPDGSLPVLSDSDSHSDGTLTLMGLVFGQPDWMRYAKPTARDYWFLGPIEKQTAEAPRERPPAVAFPASGYYVMRSGDHRDALQLVFDCGTQGGSHGHFDLLNFELFGFGRTVIADPGRHVYDDSPERHWALGTPAHNTISLDGENHARIEQDEAGLIHFARWEVEGSHILVSAWHEGYRHLSGCPVVGRTIWFDRKSVFAIADWMSSDAEHEATVSFTLPGANLPPTPGGGVRSGRVVVRPALQPGQSSNLAKSFYSPNYGSREPAMRLTVMERAKKSVFVTLVQAFETEPASWELGDVDVSLESGVVRLRMGGKDGAVSACLEPPFLWG